jgi:DNA invertase Pin-like site-specific DNA recombinase
MITMPTEPINAHDAIYVRVSSRKQDQASQLPDLKRWQVAQDDGAQAVWYQDKATGKSMTRPAWADLEAAMKVGLVRRVIVWRLDRLGRTARGLTALFHDLEQAGIGLVSMREGLDLDTPAGKLMANVLASVAQYETEVRAERIQAGIEVARERGTRSGRAFGRPKGSGKPIKLTAGKRQKVLALFAEGKDPTFIARACELSRTTVYAIRAAGK